MTRKSTSFGMWMENLYGEIHVTGCEEWEGKHESSVNCAALKCRQRRIHTRSLSQKKGGKKKERRSKAKKIIE